MNILILHKFGGSPNDLWYPWVKEQLESAGHSVLIPQLPNPSEPKLAQWLKAAKDAYKSFNPDIIIGHSLGGALALKLAQEVGQEGKIKKIILVAPPVHAKEGEKLHRTEFFEEPIKWEILKSLAIKYTVFHSIDDPSVPADHAQIVRDKLEANYKLFFDRGHFLQQDFPELIEAVSS